MKPKRPAGTVSGAILRVLENASGPMSLAHIHAAVEKDLGGPVAPTSVRGWLAESSQITRVAHGVYRLRDKR